GLLAFLHVTTLGYSKLGYTNVKYQPAVVLGCRLVANRRQNQPCAAFDTASHASQVFNRLAYASRTSGRLYFPRNRRNGGLGASTTAKTASGVARGLPWSKRWMLPNTSAFNSS